jgi:bifunctional enzyme CysN/CysC
MTQSTLLSRATAHTQLPGLTRDQRACQKLQKPLCLWLTGLPGAGKSTLATLLERHMFAMGCHTYVLDGDNLRRGLNRDLGFSQADRVENIRRATEVARLFVDAGLVVIVALISPYRSERARARSQFEPGDFVEIYVHSSAEESERRYEAPENPEVHLDTVANDPDECTALILAHLQAK